MSELVKWFAKRKETKAIEAIQRHLSLTSGIVEDLEKAMEAGIEENIGDMQESIKRVTSGEREADALRRKVMDEVSSGELSPIDREDLMNLVKRVDMVADWSRESTRILGAIPMKHVPTSIKGQLTKMVKSVIQCVMSLQKCVNKMITKSEEALQAADAVEREEEKVDDTHEEARILLGKEDLPKAGVAVLVSELFEAMEMIADSCEDACDQIRVIVIRK